MIYNPISLTHGDKGKDARQSADSGSRNYQAATLLSRRRVRGAKAQTSEPQQLLYEQQKVSHISLSNREIHREERIDLFSKAPEGKTRSKG